MSLRILFADDSMTAQNMGKKILSEAGYDVVAVSNGAAAVKKIAEQKPDIIILDVYMPGYTGLEVCEKVRGSIETLKTPVLLTVGKMEPYKPEDANRVKADGVIIKPFEASDLLAIVKKFEERIENAPAIFAQAAPASSHVEEPQAEAPMETQTPSNKASMQPMVEVPDHMASSAAFGDLLGNEPASAPPSQSTQNPRGLPSQIAQKTAQSGSPGLGAPEPNHFAVNTPSAAFETSVIVPAPPIVLGDETASLPNLEQPPVAIAPEPEPPSPEAVMAEMDAAPEVTVTPVEPPLQPAQNRRGPGAPWPEALLEHEEPAQEPEVAHQEPAYAAAAAVPPQAETELAHPQFIPVFKEPEAPQANYDFIPTAAAPVDEVEIPREPALQESAEETTRNTIADQMEPGLMSAIEAAAAPSGVDAASDAISTAEPAVPSTLPVTEASSDVSDADFEARVAAAMAAYNHATDGETAHAVVEPHEIPAEHAVAAVAVPSFEYHPAAGSAPAAPESTPLQHEQPAVARESGEPAAVAATADAAVPEAAASAAAESGADHHTIAQAIHRVMERLKPELLEEIMKELKPKK
ncbi:MAG TPA: response regulator [Candidatus Angelobacter sp.]|nr:response regulator [Candidatus Angelobacter sp.]